jgi:hypothetical protein
MLKFGKIFIERLLKLDIVFITKMVTALITTLIIWNYLLLVNMLQIMQKNFIKIKNIEKKILNNWKKLENLLVNGIEVVNENNGIKNIMKKIKKIFIKKNTNINVLNVDVII